MVQTSWPLTTSTLMFVARDGDGDADRTGGEAEGDGLRAACRESEFIATATAGGIGDPAGAGNAARPTVCSPTVKKLSLTRVVVNHPRYEHLAAAQCEILRDHRGVVVGSALQEKAVLLADADLLEIFGQDVEAVAGRQKQVAVLGDDRRGQDYRPGRNSRTTRCFRRLQSQDRQRHSLLPSSRSSRVRPVRPLGKLVIPDG